MVGDRFFRQIYSACWDPDVRLQEMDRDGIEMQVISATPVLFAYDRPVEHALDCAQLFNDAALELCSRGKGRLKSLCQVLCRIPTPRARNSRDVCALAISACKSATTLAKGISTIPAS